MYDHFSSWKHVLSLTRVQPSVGVGDVQNGQGPVGKGKRLQLRKGHAGLVPGVGGGRGTGRAAVHVEWEPDEGQLVG